MSMVATERKWKAIEVSVRGASHVRADLPNQDAAKVDLPRGGSPPAVLAVSDGHGSAKCFRSHEGSRFAVDDAVAILREFADSMAGIEPREVRRLAEQDLPRAIVRKWRESVQSHWRENPFREDELDRLDEPSRAAVERAIAAGDPFIVYGATLIVVLLTTEFIIYLQLGDGEILTVSEKTGQVESPLSADDELIANETTSLCLDEAWKKFRFRFQYLVEPAHSLVLLATDGYPNSFATPEGFQQVANDLLNLFDRDGVEKVAESLPGWLEEASSRGSGDDISAAILYCAPLGPRPAGPDNASRNQVEASEPAPSSGPSLNHRLFSVARQTASILKMAYAGLRRWLERHPDVAVASMFLNVLLIASVCLYLLIQ